MTNKYSRHAALLAALTAISAATSSSLSAKTCAVVDGVVAEVSPGAFLPSSEAVTLKSTYKAEFRWNPDDREAIGWMRITDVEGTVIGWLPTGHEGVRCGESN
ncbi:MAG: hypothetical protein ACKVP4_11400 [Hyphomicrobium sp.]